jgi:hypothetical protein
MSFGSTRRAWRMFQTEAWDFAPSLGWENLPFAYPQHHFWRFCEIGTVLDWEWASARR